VAAATTTDGPAGADGKGQFAAMHAGVHGGEHRPVPLFGGHEGCGRVMDDLELRTGPALVRRQVLQPVAAREDGLGGGRTSICTSGMSCPHLTLFIQARII
jgi:hypothetical protein